MKWSKRPKKVVLFAGCGGADLDVEAVLGSSVRPEVAEALVRANLGDELADRSAA